MLWRMTVAAIHHLNCGSFAPPGLPGVLPSRLVSHVLLVERSEGLLLVDTGFGLDDCRQRGARLGRVMTTLLGAALEESETALSQLAAAGFTAGDVRDIVLTHLDLDHAGGLADFPEADVHVHRAELEAATRPRPHERARYVPAQVAHGPRWVTHDLGGDDWFGFAGVRALGDDVVLIPLAGHTRGHVGVAVRRPEGGWLLHAGDAYFHAGEKVTPRRCPPGLRAFQHLVASQDGRRLANLRRVQELHARHGDEVTVFSAHDQSEYAALVGLVTPGT